MEIIPEPDWKALYEDLLHQKGTAIIMGATDSGKSTLSRYLIRKLASRNLRVCFIDSDLGQSSLCLPGTVSMRIFHNQRDTESFRCEKFSFIGATNPAKRIPIILETLKRISKDCNEHSDITLIDTSGLIGGEVGQALKIGKINTVRPEHVIAVQRAEELEHILRLIVNVNIYRIKTSDNAKPRTIATRAQYRKKKYDEYFRKDGIHNFILHSNEVTFLYNGRSFKIREGAFEEGTLMGLNQGDDTIALGILEDISGNVITFMSPIESLRKIDRVIFGDIKI